MECSSPESLILKSDENFSGDEIDAESSGFGHSPRLSYSENSFTNLTKVHFDKELNEVKRLDLILREKLNEEKETYVTQKISTPAKRSGKKNARKTSISHSSTAANTHLLKQESAGHKTKGTWKKGIELACADLCMTDAEKIRLEQLMSDAPMEAFVGPGTITDLRKEMLSNDAFAFDSTTRKRLDEIDEELKKLQAAYSKHNQQVSSQERNLEVIECEEFDEITNFSGLLRAEIADANAICKQNPQDDLIN